MNRYAPIVLLTLVIVGVSAIVGNEYYSYTLDNPSFDKVLHIIEDDPIYKKFIEKYPDADVTHRPFPYDQGKMILLAYNETKEYINTLELDIQKWNDNPNVQTFLHCRLVDPTDSSNDVHIKLEGDAALNYLENYDCLEQIYSDPPKIKTTMNP